MSVIREKSISTGSEEAHRYKKYPQYSDQGEACRALAPLFYTSPQHMIFSVVPIDRSVCVFAPYRLLCLSFSQFDIVQALLESGANPNLQDLKGDNAAHIASRSGNLEVRAKPKVYCKNDSRPHERLLVNFP